jgi:hypothetical protein
MIADKHSPVRIGTNNDWSSISAGDYHSLALKTDGTLWAWGYNHDGELGNGTTNDEWSPVQISSDTWKAVSAGSLHNMAVKNDGTLWGWGANQAGQIGDGTNINRPSPVHINFQTYTITAAAGSGGMISPSGPVTVIHGSSQAFTIMPDTGYHIASVTGCGGILSGNTYTTGAITADCMVTAAFAINTYTVTPSAGANGAISPATVQTVNYGSTVPFTITSNTGYHIASVTGCGGTLSGNTYTTGAITANCTVTASFAINTYTITTIITGGSGGTITPSSPTVNYGSSWTFTITPNTGYRITDVRVDGVSQGAINSYTFTNITSNHTLEASFAINTYTLVIAKDGTGTGTITSTPAGITCGSDCSEAYLQGASVTLSATAALGSSFIGWSGGGCSGTGSCTVTLNSDITVTAEFTMISTAVRAISAGTGYTLAIGGDGALWTWGQNDYGQLGDGTTTNKSTPVKIGSDKDWAVISAGFDHRKIKGSGLHILQGRVDNG